MHQVIFREYFNTTGFQFDKMGKDVGGTVKQGSGEHSALYTFFSGVVFSLVSCPNIIKQLSRDIDAVFHMVEQTARQ